jgi:hypothetical protein
MQNNVIQSVVAKPLRRFLKPYLNINDIQLIKLGISNIVSTIDIKMAEYIKSITADKIYNFVNGEIDFGVNFLDRDLTPESLSSHWNNRFFALLEVELPSIPKAR